MNGIHTQTEVHRPMRVPFEGSGVIVLGDRWQSVKWQCKASSRRGRCGVLWGVEMWADDVLRHLHQVGTQLDIFTKSRASACTNKRSVLKKEMASVHLTERLANMPSEQELWTSYPLGAQEARAHAFHADSALRYTLSLRPFARCVAADWPLRGTNSTTGASMAPTANPCSGRPRRTTSFSKQLESNEAQTRGTRPTGTGPLLPPSARAALDWDRSRSPFFLVHIAKFRPPSWLKGRDFLQVDPPKAARPHGTSPIQRPVAASSCHLHDRDQDALRRAASRAAQRDSEPGAFFAFDTTLGHSKDGNKHAARKAGRCASARRAPSQRGAGPLGAGGQHLNSQSRQSVAGAAAGTRGGMDLGCVSPRPGCRWRTWPRREALPVLLAALVQWERWICSGSAPEHEVLFIGGILLMAWAGLRFADAQCTCPASLLPDRRPAERMLADQSLQIWSAIRRPWSASMSWAFIRLQTFFFFDCKVFFATAHRLATCSTERHTMKI